MESQGEAGQDDSEERTMEDVNERAPAEALPQPKESGPRNQDIREMRITRRVLEKFGYSTKRIGCTAAQSGAEKRRHTDACRQRLYEAMSKDPIELP